MPDQGGGSKPIANKGFIKRYNPMCQGERRSPIRGLLGLIVKPFVPTSPQWDYTLGALGFAHHIAPLELPQAPPA